MTVTQELQVRTAGRKRFVELDGLRGLAAFIVIWQHFRFAFHYYDPAWYLRPLFSGHPSVVMFFVLSGYVLALPVWNDKQPPYGAYLIRRFFRIYVPYAAAALVALVGAHFFRNAQAPLTSWFYMTWHTPLTRTLILRQFLTMPTSAALNTAFWSLRTEAEMSLVMPFVAYGIRKVPIRISVAATLAAIVILPWLHLHENNDRTAAQLLTLIWAMCFVAGALLSYQRAEIARLYARIPITWKIVVFILTVYGYYSDSNTLVIVACCAVIILGLNSRAHRWLGSAVPEYLGRVSYSMYLIHGTVLWILLIVVLPHVAIWQLVLIYLAIVLVASHLFCILVEEPSLRFGKRLTSSPRPFAALATRTQSR